MPKVGGTSGPANMTSTPIGGNSGQVLTKNSSADRDWSWQNGSLADPFAANTYLSGYWYSNAVLFNSATSGGSTSVANAVTFFPLFLPYAVTITALAYSVPTANTGQTNLGVYSTENGLPATLLCSVTGLSQAAGVRSAKLATACTLPAGWVYLAITFVTVNVGLQPGFLTTVPLVPGGLAETPATVQASYGVVLYTPNSGGVFPVAPTTFTNGSPGLVSPIWFRVL